MIYKICKLNTIIIRNQCVRINEILSYYQLLFRHWYFLQILNKYLNTIHINQWKNLFTKKKKKLVK